MFIRLTKQWITTRQTSHSARHDLDDSAGHPPADCHLEGPRNDISELAAPHVLDELSETFGNFSLHPERVVLVDVFQIIIVVKILGDLRRVTEPLYDAVHEAGVAQVGETADAGLGLVAQPAVPVSRGTAAAARNNE